MLPHIVLELLCVRELLDEVLDRVLAETEEVRARDRVGVLPVADVVRRAHDDGPRARRSACDDGLVRHVLRDDLEFGPVAAVEDRAVVHDLCVRIYGGKVAPSDDGEIKG